MRAIAITLVSFTLLCTITPSTSSAQMTDTQKEWALDEIRDLVERPGRGWLFSSKNVTQIQANFANRGTIRRLGACTK